MVFVFVFGPEITICSPYKSWPVGATWKRPSRMWNIRSLEIGLLLPTTHLTLGTRRRRQHAYNEGFGSTIYIMRECPEEEHCKDNFGRGLAISWKTGMEADRPDGTWSGGITHDTRGCTHMVKYTFQWLLIQWFSVCHNVRVPDKAAVWHRDRSI